MKSERIILSLIAICIGLLVAGGAFYLFQLTKQIPDNQVKTVTVKAKASPTPLSTNFLAIESPKDESINKNQTVTVSGKTIPESTIIISTGTTDQVVNPSSSGSFSATATLDEDTTLITITAVFPNGEEKTVTRTVSYTSEDF